MLEVSVLAYMAGLIDGEGTVTITKRASTCKFRAPFVTLTSTTPALVDFCKEHFGGHIVKQKTYKAHHKSSQTWQLTGDAALRLCELLLPYIREPEKMRRMQLLTTRFKSVTPRNGKYTPEQLILKEQFEADFLHPSCSISEDLGTL